MALAALVLGAAPMAEAKGGYGEASWDWRRGVVRLRVGVAGSLRSPTRALARIRSQRLAEEEGRKRLVAALSSPPWAAEAAPNWSAKQEELEERVGALSASESIDYGSDGSVVLDVVMPIDSLRALAYGSDPVPTLEGEGPDVLLVDATRLPLEPGLGLALAHESEPGELYRGPTLWFRSAAAARKDGRLKGKIREIRSSKSEKGTLWIADKGVDLTSLRAHSTLVVVLWKPRTK